MPYTCRHCGGEFCSDHRLPESHDCVSLKLEELQTAKGEAEPDPDSIDQSSGITVPRTRSLLAGALLVVVGIAVLLLYI